jgi:hypothetical protein
MVTMLVVGGMGSVPGAILGAFLVSLAPEYLRLTADYRMLIYGVMVVVVMNYLPGGLVQLIERPLRRFVVRHGWAETDEGEEWPDLAPATGKISRQ